VDKFIKLLESYAPISEQEAQDKALISKFVERHHDALSRTNLAGHVTSSIIILNSEKTHILLGYHNIYDAWGWFGGHNDGDADCYAVALKEVREETGLETFVKAPNDPIALDVIYVQNHLKNGAYVPDHLHLNITYGFLADDQIPLKVNAHEHQALRWFPLETYLDEVDEVRMKPIYQKIVERMLNQS